MSRNLYSGYVFIRYPATITAPKEITCANHEYHAVFTPASISNLDLAKAQGGRVIKNSTEVNKINLRYFILMTVIKVLILTYILTPVITKATDFGKQGQTLKVLEEPFITGS